MVDFKNKHEIREWLNTQLREVVSIVAARSALRLAPSFGALWSSPKTSRQAPDIILPSFWATASALSAGIWPDRTIETAVPTTAAYAAYVAAIPTVTYAYAAAAAAASADTVPAAAATATDAAFSQDHDFIEAGGSAKDLITQPLWSGDIMPADFQAEWNTLRKHLLALGDDWEVWTQWYQDRIDGKALIEALEIGDPDKGGPDEGAYGRATFPPEDYKTPALINAKIKKMEEDYWAERALTQDKSAETFAVNDNGKITVTTQEIGLGLTVDAAQTSWYDELRQAATEALSEGENVLGAASRPIERLAKALPEDITQARTPRLWTCTNKIRRLLERHDNVAGKEFDANLLNENAADALRAITDAYNNLRIGDAALLQADERAPNPRDVAEILEQDAPLMPLLEDAIRDDITDAEASEVLQLVLDDIETQNDIMGRDPSLIERAEVGQNHRTNSNFVASILQEIRDTPQGLRDIKNPAIRLATRGKLIGLAMGYSGAIIAFVSFVWPSLVGWVTTLLASLG